MHSPQRPALPPPPLLPRAQLTSFGSALRGTAVQQPARRSGVGAAPLRVQAATQVVTRKLKAGSKAAKPPPPPPRKAGGGTQKVGGAKPAPASGTQARKVGGTQVIEVSSAGWLVR